MHNSLDEILDLCLSTRLAGTFVVNRTWHTEWQIKLERHSVGARIEEVSGNFENAHFVVGKPMVVLDAFRSSLVTILPKAGKSSFLSSFYFNLNVTCSQRLQHFNENLSVNGVSGLIEWEFSLYLNPALREVASSV